MEVVGILSQKGGSGKTTLTCHLAVQAMLAGRATVMIDTDPQQSLTEWWRVRKQDGPRLVEAPVTQLPELLAAARAAKVERVFIDSRPSVEEDAALIASVSDFVLVPTRPAALDLWAIPKTIALLRQARARAAVVLNFCTPGRGFGQVEATSTVDARAAAAGYGLPVCPVAICQRVALEHALRVGHAVAEFEPNSKAAVEISRLNTWMEQFAWLTHQRA